MSAKLDNSVKCWLVKPSKFAVCQRNLREIIYGFNRKYVAVESEYLLGTIAAGFQGWSYSINSMRSIHHQACSQQYIMCRIDQILPII